MVANESDNCRREVYTVPHVFLSNLKERLCFHEFVQHVFVIRRTKHKLFLYSVALKRKKPEL